MATPSYRWEQTAERVEVTVTLPGLNKRNLNSFCTVTDVYLGITFPPKLLALDFLGKVIPKEVTAKIAPPEVAFSIPKAEEGEWATLTQQPENKEQKAEILARRKTSLEEARKQQKEYREKRAQARKDRMKAAQQKLWDKQAEMRNAIEDIEEESRTAAQKELLKWTRPGPTTEAQKDPAQAIEPAALPTQPKKKKKTLAKAMAKAFDPTGDSKKREKARKTTVTYQDEAPAAPLSEGLPPIRKALPPVTVKFSEWDYPGPKRQEKEPPEFMKKTKPPKGELTTASMTENHPLYLRDKGKKHFEAGDFISASNAFAEAGKLSEESTDGASAFVSLEIALCLAESHRQLGFQAQNEEQDQDDEKGGTPPEGEAGQETGASNFHASLQSVEAVLAKIPRPGLPEDNNHVLPSLVALALRALLWDELGMSVTGIKKDTQAFTLLLQRKVMGRAKPDLAWGVWGDGFSQLTLEVQRLLLRITQEDEDQDE